MRFTQFYSGSTVCAPSRGALLTGLHTGHAHVRDNQELGGFLDEEERGQVPLSVHPTSHNIDYLRTKRDRLGHDLPGLDAEAADQVGGEQIEREQGSTR